MIVKQQLIALYTIIRREMVRMLRISSQTFLPPVITTSLYFLIFGDILGNRIGSIANNAYATFIAPGLITLGIITNAYSNVSTSLFSMRFQRSIEEILVSPMHWSVMLFGYVSGGIIRGLVVAALITLAASFFVSLHVFQHLIAITSILTLISATFSLAGFLNGMMARTFDDVAFVPTFVLTPLIYLGGVFYTVNMLPGIFQTITLFNPIYYMVHALRYVMLGQSDGSIMRDFIVIGSLFIGLLIMNAVFIKKGIGLRD